jgi:hypothetical protein
VRSDGVENTAVQTSFHCTNFSGANETTRIVIRAFTGLLVVNTPVMVAHLGTVTFQLWDDGRHVLGHRRLGDVESKLQSSPWMRGAPHNK